MRPQTTPTTRPAKMPAPPLSFRLGPLAESAGTASWSKRASSTSLATSSMSWFLRRSERTDSRSVAADCTMLT